MYSLKRDRNRVNRFLCALAHIDTISILKKMQVVVHPFFNIIVFKKLGVETVICLCTEETPSKLNSGWCNGARLKCRIRFNSFFHYYEWQMGSLPILFSRRWYISAVVTPADIFLKIYLILFTYKTFL